MQSHLPHNFLKSLEGLPGFDKEPFVEVHEQGRQLTSIRLNPAKPTAAVNDLPLESTVPWCSTGRYLTERPSFTLSPIFHGGAYYVQEASSMFIQYVLEELYKNVTPPTRVLDLCAAPGGKSTDLEGGPGTFLLFNEFGIH